MCLWILITVAAGHLNVAENYNLTKKESQTIITIIYIYIKFIVFYVL
jgi:hypothetical protein